MQLQLDVMASLANMKEKLEAIDAIDPRAASVCSALVKGEVFPMLSRFEEIIDLTDE